MAKGGRRSWAGRPARHQKTSAYRSVDVRRLQRDGLLADGRAFSRHWRDDAGNETASIGLRVHDGGVRFNYRLNDEVNIDQHVRLTTTACNYGGERVWFICPYCVQRCALVYISRQVACRKCLRLKYPSQSDDVTDATWRKQRKLEARLGGADYWRKPKGMHQSTFDRIREQIAEQETIRNADLVLKFRRMFGHDLF